MVLPSQEARVPAGEDETKAPARLFNVEDGT
jgi:hypothetical protein